MEKIKVIVVGEIQTGKTSIVNRLLRDEFIQDIPTTIIKTENSYVVESQNVIFDIGDTAGQEKYRSINKLYFKQVGIVLFVYAIDNEKSFNTINDYWIKVVKEESKPLPRKNY